MNKVRKYCAMGLCGSVLCGGLAAAQDAETIDDAFKMGSLKGKLGLFYQHEEDGGVDDTKLVNGFIELSYKTGYWNGLQLNTKLLHNLEAWDDDDANDTHPEYYGDGLDGAVKEFHVKYKFMNSWAKVGRHKTAKTPLMDGDSHEGLTLGVGEWEDAGVSVSAAVLNRWINDLAWDDGVDEWEDINEPGGAFADGASLLYLLQADVDVAPGVLSVNPYLMHQSDAATVVGIQGIARHELEEGSVHGTLDYYKIWNKLDGANQADSQAWKAYLGGEMAGLSAGAGYLHYSDIDPGESQLASEEWLDDLKGFEEGGMKGDNANVWWLDLGHKWDAFKGSLQYGEKQEDNKDDYEEWSVKLGYDIGKNLAANFLYVDMDGDDLIQISTIYKF